MSQTDPRTERLALSILDAALQLPSDEQRNAALAQCDGDVRLEKRVRDLLRAMHSDTRALDEAKVPVTLIDRSGDTVGIWQLTEKVAEGGMGAVYRARRVDGVVEFDAAVKLLRHPLLTGPQLARFDAERSILARINHPNIARIVDAGAASDGTPYLVMEFVDGVEITEFVKERNLDLRHRVKLVIAVLEAVAEVHRNLVAHRDIKPSNVLVDSTGRPRLLDFGIAKLLDDDDVDLTETGGRLFTPAYASPEQVCGEHPTTASDIYAVGLVAHELLTGERAQDLRASTPAQIQHQICDVELAPPSTVLKAGGQSSLSRQVRGDLDNVVMKALEKDPVRRYSSATEFSSDLDNFLSGRPVLARSPSVGYRMRRFVGRNRWAVSGVLLALVAIAFLMWRWSQEATYAQAQSERAMIQGERAERVSTFLENLLINTSPDVTGQNPSMLDMLGQAAEQASELEDDPLTEARVRATIGWAMLNVLPPEEAAIQLDRALELQTRFLDDDHPDLARTRYYIGWLRFEQGELTRSLASYDRAIEVFAQLPGHEVQLIDALNDKSVVLSLNGEATQALELQERAVAAAVASPSADTGNTATLYSNLGLAHHGIGNLDRARTAFDQAIELFNMDDTNPVHLAIALSNRALVARDSGDLSAAVAFLEDSLRIRETLSDREGFVARGQINLATNLIEIGEIERASGLMRPALASERERLVDDHRLQPWLGNARANLLRAEGDLVAAEAGFRQALDELRAAEEPVAEWINGAMLGLGHTLFAAGRDDEAIVALREARDQLAVSPGTHSYRYKQAVSLLAHLEKP